jgi:hypothetical protein
VNTPTIPNVLDGLEAPGENEDDANATECSKCHGALDTTDYPRWCKACRNKYRQVTRPLGKKIARSAGFAAGAEAMRAYLADEFEKRFPKTSIQRFSGPEIAHTIRGVSAPAPPSVEAEAA